MLKKLPAGLFAILASATVVACDEDNGPDQDETEFEATLTGAAERPTPVSTNATGTATVTIDEANQTLTFNVTVSSLVDATLAHIHTGGVDEAGPPVVTLLSTQVAGTTNGVLASGTIQASAISGGETFATLVEKIRNGTTYVNVHTVANASGEIRGQLVEDD
jgi:hypothetical protein